MDTVIWTAIIAILTSTIILTMIVLIINLLDNR